MNTIRRRLVSAMAILMFGSFVFLVFGVSQKFDREVIAQTAATPTPAPLAFDQKAAIAKLKEQIKGRENDLAPTVFKNIQTLKNIPAGRLPAIMEFGFARSLGVDCSHCHVPDKWESEEKTQKQTARDMWAMMGKINGELLKNIKNLKSATPTINCTTCHRGEIKPALNLPTPKS